MMHVDIARAPQGGPQPSVMTEPAVGVAQTLGALEDCTRIDEDEVRGQMLSQSLDPLALVSDEDSHHELIDPIGNGFGTAAQWHGGSFAESPATGQAARVAQT